MAAFFLVRLWQSSDCIDNHTVRTIQLIWKFCYHFICPPLFHSWSVWYSGYTIWVLEIPTWTNHSLRFVTETVKKSNMCDLERLPLIEVQEGFQLTEMHVTRDGFSYWFQLTKTVCLTSALKLYTRNKSGLSFLYLVCTVLIITKCRPT